MVRSCLLIPNSYIAPLLTCKIHLHLMYLNWKTVATLLWWLFLVPAMQFNFAGVANRRKKHSHLEPWSQLESRHQQLWNYCDMSLLSEQCLTERKLLDFMSVQYWSLSFQLFALNGAVQFYLSRLPCLALKLSPSVINMPENVSIFFQQKLWKG